MWCIRIREKYTSFRRLFKTVSTCYLGGSKSNWNLESFNLSDYMGMMDEIRQEMAEETSQPPGLFSFNSIGACPNCSGKGVTQPDLAFADPVTMTCEACQGKRYSKEALSYTYQGLTIADVLSLTIEQLANYFKSPKITRQIARLKDVGMGYITLGQTTSTLSGGELQRLKL